MKNLYFLCFLFTLVSCLSDQSDNSKSEPSVPSTPIEKQVKKQLIIEVDIEMTEPEDLKLMAINTFLNNGKFIDIYLTQKIYSNEPTKKVKFEMPENITPDNFVGISLGPKKIKEVKINSVSISFGELNYQVASENVLDFFNTNNFVDYDETRKVFKTKEVDGKHNPILILRKLYIEKFQDIR